MAKRTLQSCWKQFEKLSYKYLDDPTDAKLAALDDLVGKANGDSLGQSLYMLFVKPHLPLDLSVVFECTLDEEGKLPKWRTFYSSEQQNIMVHPIAAYRFIREIQKVEIVEDDYEDFLHLRYLSFIKEVGKLPPIYLLFMLVLQRVAYLLEIAHLEKRGGIIEVAEGEAYHTLLWAFKELERFVQGNWGVQVRSHYHVSWYESEWITGR
jgi:hypothetical protein